MNTEPLPSQNDIPITPLPPTKSRRPYIPHLASWIVGILVFLMLVGLMMPVTHSVCVKSPQTKALAQAKQIGLALKLFASDNDGQYPRAGLPAMLGAEVKDSNTAFAVLFPTYVQNEMLFANKLSAYQTRQPDNQISPYDGKPGKTLEPGENVYAYFAGLTDKPDDTTPLIVDGTDGTGHYTTDAKKRGGVWKGARAIVIRLDNSGSLETLRGPEHARYIPRDGHAFAAESIESERPSENFLDPSNFGPDVRLLDPAVHPR